MTAVLKDEALLRQHVYSILKGYALSHLTRDYVKYTSENASAILSAGLKLIPSTTPGDVSMAVDPLESFLHQVSIMEPSYPDDRFKLDENALSRIKLALSSVAYTTSSDPIYMGIQDIRAIG